MIADQATSAIGKNLLGGMSSGSGVGGWLGDFVSGIFGGGFTAGGTRGMSWSFPKANGGWAPPNSIQEVNERGFETLRMGQKQYLMMGKEGGQVLPNSGGAGRGMQVVNHFSIQGPVDRRTELNIALHAGNAIQNAMRRNG
jgi:hypothetical protein